MENQSFLGSLKSKIKRLLGKFVFWVADVVLRMITEKGPEAPAPQRISAYKESLGNPFEEIVHDVVDILGYAGAMVATYETGDALRVQAIYVDPKIATEEQIHEWEKQASEYTAQPISLTDPDIAVVYPHQERYQENLGSMAFRTGQSQIRDDLFALFTPIVPKESRGLIDLIQQALHIQQVIAMPFYIETETPQGMKKEFVGNMFAAKGTVITGEDENLLRSFAHYIASFMLSQRQRLQLEVIEKLILDIQKNLTDEKAVLARIARGVVEDLGYAGAMVATYEEDDSLPVRAIYVEPDIATEEQIRTWEKQASEFTDKPISLTDAEIAVVYPHKESYQENLSSIAFKSGQPEIRDSLFYLFTPVVPKESRGLIDLIQQTLGVRHVIAVPFYTETETTEGIKKQFVGNLFAASLSYDIHDWEIGVLESFGHQAGVGLRNVRLYRQTSDLYKMTEQLYKKAEARREAAAIFGKMAFTASASVHKLRNQIAAVQLTLQTVNSLTMVPAEMREEILNEIVQSDQIENVLRKLDEMKNLVQTLHEPWRRIDDTVVDVNSCIKQAADKVDSNNEAWVKLYLSEEPLLLMTSQEMMIEAFKVMIKNAREAMPEEDHRLLEIRSGRNGSQIVVSLVDHGTGIDPRNMERIFEMRFTTKEGGLGFGLFWAKDYIEGLGGEINVESDLQKGTTFYISLPPILPMAKHDL